MSPADERGRITSFHKTPLNAVSSRSLRFFFSPPAFQHLHQKSITKKLWKWNTICTLFAVEKKILLKQWKIYLFRLSARGTWRHSAKASHHINSYLALKAVLRSDSNSISSNCVLYKFFWRSRWKKRKSFFFDARGASNLSMLAFFPPGEL